MITPRALAVALAGAAALVLLAAGTGLAAWKNLKMLPEDISDEDLDATMTRMARSLGVGCGHCHVSMEEPELDERAAKSTARAMIRMTVALNRDHFGYPDAPLVTCMTCHNGRVRPRTRRHGDPLDEPLEGPPGPVPGAEPPPAAPEGPPGEPAPEEPSGPAPSTDPDPPGAAPPIEPEAPPVQPAPEPPSPP